MNHITDQSQPLMNCNDTLLYDLLGKPVGACGNFHFLPSFLPSPVRRRNKVFVYVYARIKAIYMLQIIRIFFRI